MTLSKKTGILEPSYTLNAWHLCEKLADETVDVTSIQTCITYISGYCCVLMLILFTQWKERKFRYTS